ncbi:MAG: hypothetical protein IT460_01000 [Planctomycetes bacterium]|nr:hypothetical protein [Planctomycetota bacterium]
MRARLVAVPAALLVLATVGCGEKDAPAGGAKGGAAPVKAADAPAGGYGYAAALGSDLDKKVGDALRNGRKFLLSVRDEATGTWEPKMPVSTGFTAFATLALIGSLERASVATDPVVLAALEAVAKAQKENGAIWGSPQFINYETSAAVSAFAAARIAKFAPVQTKARDYLVASQIRGDAKDPSYGGFPYRSEKDPEAPVDLSNAQHAATAAADAGVADAEFWARVAAYASGVQNRSESNRSEVKVKVGDRETTAVAGNDGGAGYAPGRSKADYVERPDGKVEPRSYGSMTYALLKCYLLAGVKADDPRVQAAVGWISRNFTVERNPGFEQAKDPAKAGMQGYFYYLQTMARALAEYEKATGKVLAVTDAAGRPHEWRKEVAAKLVSLQRADGSWANDIERWEEAMPVLATSYAMQALATCQGRLP